MRTLVWFRGKDLRLSDHEPLSSAAEGEVLPVFVLDPYFFSPERARELPHRLQFLLDGLESLEKNLRAKGSRLLLFRGKSVDVLPKLVEAFRVDRVVAQRWVEPLGTARDALAERRLRVPFELFWGETLLPPGSVRNGSGQPYGVYSPFARAHRSVFVPTAPLGVPKLSPLPELPVLEEAVERPPSLEELGLIRNPELLVGGERAASERLRAFLEGPLADYAEGRDRLPVAGTSRLSADLKFGTLSVRKIVSELRKVPASKSREKFESELLWREFAYSTFWDRPELAKRPFRPEFVNFPWGFSEPEWTAWAEGRTGYPVVDAAARQLLREGYVHNRARMIAASFLTKHLLIHYRYGEAHYLKYLTDGDWAINNMGWQWSAGCGVDAQPYFRVFNPITQGEKFDPDGEYVRRYVPELAALPAKYIHAPFRAPDGVLRAAGVTLGKTYPLPVVDHDVARRRFLELASRSVGKNRFLEV